MSVAAFEPVSVVIPTHNRASMVGRAIDSVLAALLPGDEVVVVDDGSTDRTSEVLGAYGARIRVVRTTNGGAGRARNRGVREARHSLIAFLDSDDEWMPDRLLLGRQLLAARPDILFCFSNFGLRSPGEGDRHNGLAGWHRDPRPWGEILGPGRRYTDTAPLPPGRSDFSYYVGNLYRPLLHWGYVAVQTLLVRRDAAGEALRFAEDLPLYEDWECLARVARVGPAAFLECETAWQWGHDAPRLTNANDYVGATARIQMVERIWARDQEFMAQYAGEVSDVLRASRLTRSNWLIRFGRNSEARAELRNAGGAPMSRWLLASMPGAVTRAIVGARDLVVRRLEPAKA